MFEWTSNFIQPKKSFCTSMSHCLTKTYSLLQLEFLTCANRVALTPREAELEYGTKLWSHPQIALRTKHDINPKHKRTNQLPVAPLLGYQQLCNVERFLGRKLLNLGDFLEVVFFLHVVSDVPRTTQAVILHFPRQWTSIRSLSTIPSIVKHYIDKEATRT